MQGHNDFNSVKAERGEAVAEEKFGVGRVLFMEFKERNHLCYIKLQGKAASVDSEAAASCPEHLGEIINEDACMK